MHRSHGGWRHALGATLLVERLLTLRHRRLLPCALCASLGYRLRMRRSRRLHLLRCLRRLLLRPLELALQLALT